MKHRFKVGDEVQLIKPFRYDGDDEDDDEEFDKNIRASGNRGDITGLESDGYGIEWDGAGHLYSNEDVVDLLYQPVTDDEIAEAIESIQQASRSKP